MVKGGAIAAGALSRCTARLKRVLNEGNGEAHAQANGSEGVREDVPLLRARIILP